MEKTSTGLSENVTGSLCYCLGWITGIVFLLIERKNKFVRFHAFQSILVFSAVTFLSRIPFVDGLVSVLGIILAMVMIFTTAQGKKYKLPWAGNLAEKWAGWAGAASFNDGLEFLKAPLS